MSIVINTLLKFFFPLRAAGFTSINLLMVGLLVFTSCKEEEVTPFELTFQKISDSQVILTWTPIEGGDDYKIWRTINALDPLNPELIGTVEPNTLTFLDENQPLSSSLTYYVSTTVDGKEKKTNKLEVAGSTVLLILPYQMNLVPGKSFAIVRDYRSIVLLDYDKKVVVKRLEFPGRVGQYDLHTRNGILEAYVPCSDNNIYILNADGLEPIDTINTAKPVYAVAVNSLGKIFSSGTQDYGKLLVHDRETLALLTTASAEMDCGLWLQDDNHLITITSHLSPATMSYYTFDDEGNFTSKVDDPYGWDYEMDPDRTKVSNSYIVTSTQGFVYTADENMTYVTKLTGGGSHQSDFEFSADGNTIYSAITNQKGILRSTIINNTATSTILTTKGYPWAMARDGNTMVVLSSPTSFILSIVTNSVIVEKVTLP